MEFGFQEITIILLVAWFLMYVAGRYQQNRIKKALFTRIRTGVELALEENPGLGLNEYHAWVFSEWEHIVKNNAWFVLSQNELYPVGVHPNRMKEQMNLTPEWLGAFLKLEGTELKMDETQSAAVDSIVQMAKAQHREGSTLA